MFFFSLFSSFSQLGLCLVMEGGQLCKIEGVQSLYFGEKRHCMEEVFCFLFFVYFFIFYFYFYGLDLKLLETSKCFIMFLFSIVLWLLYEKCLSLLTMYDTTKVA